MMRKNKINVVIYSYKRKNLKEIVDLLLQKQSGNFEVHVHVFDQNPIHRKNIFLGNDSVFYNHIFWDAIVTPHAYKRDIIKHSDSEYIMVMSDNLVFNKNWDIEFSSFVNNNNKIISGKNKVSLVMKNLFYISKEFDSVEDYTLNNFIDSNFIFTRTETFNLIEYPTYIKHYGQDELLSLELFTYGLDIYSAPNNSYTEKYESHIEKVYCPFSLNHNYNEVIELMHTGKNTFSNILDRKRLISDLEDFHKIKFKDIKKLPFPINDVVYDPTRMNFNEVDGRRFVARTKAIH